MKKYLTISEFAKLRNVDVNSIRYYEKLKILLPAWIDPQTKYRYYLPDQLLILDIITLCIRLRIPLKKLQEYTDGNGDVNKRGILEDGKDAMQKRMDEMRQGLELIQFELDNMDQNQAYSNHTGVYTREIAERFFIEKPFEGDLSDVEQKEQTAMELFHYAQERELIPVFPFGILLHPNAGQEQFSFFFQVLHPRPEEERIIRVPAGTFSCLQVDLTPDTQMLDLIEKHFPQQNKGTVIISNMLMNKLHFNSRHSEIQVPQFTF